MIANLRLLLAVSLVVAAILTTPLVLARWMRYRRRQIEREILRILWRNHPMPLDPWSVGVAMMGDVSLRDVEAIMSEMARRGLVQWREAKAVEHVVRGGTMRSLRRAGYCVTDAGMAEVKP